MDVRKGLIIRQPWLDLILSGEKTWEMRSGRTSHRGLFGLILKGSKTVVAVAELVTVYGPLTDEVLHQSFNLHRVPHPGLTPPGKPSWNYAWELADVHRIPKPVPYTHRSEVRWVVFSPEVTAQIREQL